MEHQQRKAWATARDAREELGISERTLARWRGSGLLKPGKHWRRKFPTPTPRCSITCPPARRRWVKPLPARLICWRELSSRPGPIDMAVPA
jgi:hypothetical protein